MKTMIDLGQYQNKSDLLDVLTENLGLDSKNVTNLDALYESLMVDSGELDIVFINKANLPKELSVYFGMLSMTLEEAGEIRRNIKVNTYYGEEEENADGTRQKNL